MLASINLYLKKKEYVIEVLMNLILIVYVFKTWSITDRSSSTEIFFNEGWTDTFSPSRLWEILI